MTKEVKILLMMQIVENMFYGIFPSTIEEEEKLKEEYQEKLNLYKYTEQYIGKENEELDKI